MKFRILTLLIIVLAASSVFSQTFTVPTGRKPWYSYDGRYVVTLPWGVRHEMSRRMADSDTFGLGKGRYQLWTVSNVSLEASYVEFDKNAIPVKKPQEMFDEYVRAYSSRMNKWKAVGNRAVIIPTGVGRELVFEGVGQMRVVRFFLHEGRVVRLLADFRSDENEFQTIADAFMASLYLMPYAEALALAIKESEPEPLPQSRAGLAIRPDAEDIAKGKVKEISEEIENFGPRPSDPRSMGRNKKVDHFFDAQGFLTRSISYDVEGRPKAVTVFGFLDGKRVNKNSRVNLETTPLIGGAAGPDEIIVKRDHRFSTRVEEKYDAKRRITERTFYDNAGDLFLRAVYSYRAGFVDVYEYEKNGKLQSKITQTLDAKGNMTERSTQKQGEEIRQLYKYMEFDRVGNWTKRSVTIEVKATGKADQKTSYNEYRTIGYW